MSERAENPLDSDVRRIVKEPEGRSAGFSVRHDPHAPAHKTEFTVEQLWPDGEAEPLYVGDRDDVLHLIQALSEVARSAE